MTLRVDDHVGRLVTFTSIGNTQSRHPLQHPSFPFARYIFPRRNRGQGIKSDSNNYRLMLDIDVEGPIHKRLIPLS